MTGSTGNSRDGSVAAGEAADRSPTAADDAAGSDVDRAIEAIAGRATDVRRSETERALRRLRADRTLTERETLAVRVLAARLVCRLTSPPIATLRNADGSVAADALGLFGDERATTDPVRTAGESSRHE